MYFVLLIFSIPAPPLGDYLFDLMTSYVVRMIGAGNHIQTFCDACCCR